MSHSPNKSQYYDISRNGNRYGGANAAAGAGERGERVERGAPPPAPVAGDHHR